MSPFFNEAVILVASHLLLGDGRDVAAWQTLIQGLAELQEFIIAPLHLIFAFGVLATDRVLDYLSELNRTTLDCIVELDRIRYTDRIVVIFETASRCPTQRL